jgi:hypothetical protein
MGKDQDTPKGGVGQCTPTQYPVLDYVKQLPGTVPAVERRPSPTGTVTPIIPKRAVNPPSDGPDEATYYFPIPRDKCSPTGVFFPSGFSFPPQIDVILYFHGFKLGEFDYINKYWNCKDVFADGKLSHKGLCLRQDINTAGRRVVLIAPTMGAKPGSSASKEDMGIFQNPTGGDDFLAEVLRWIGKFVPQYTGSCVTPTLGNVVLAGHSGAGVILLTQAKGMKTPISEVWGFDSTYGEDDFHRDVVAEWLTLARLHRKDMNFFFHWATKGPGANAKELDEKAKAEGLTNVTVKQDAAAGADRGSNGPHFDTVITNFLTRVRSASCFTRDASI